MRLIIGICHCMYINQNKELVNKLMNDLIIFQESVELKVVGNYSNLKLISRCGGILNHFASKFSIPTKLNL